MSADITTRELAAALKVSYRTVERAIVAGHITPTSRTKSGRVRFSLEYAERLRGRADEARSKGHKFIVSRAGGMDPILRPRQAPPKDPTLRLDPRAWARKVAWKRQHLFRHKPSAEGTTSNEPEWSGEIAAANLRETRRRDRLNRPDLSCPLY